MSLNHLHEQSLSPANSTSPCSSPSNINVSDEELARLPVRQLNKKLVGQEKTVVMQIKQKRRTIKNRGYALKCRTRRVQNQMQLEADNIMLRDQVKTLKKVLQETQLRLQYYEPFFPMPNMVPRAAINTMNFNNQCIAASKQLLFNSTM